MTTPKSYAEMTNCPLCDVKLVWAVTSIDDVLECPVSQEHTVFLNQMDFGVAKTLVMEEVRMVES